MSKTLLRGRTLSFVEKPAGADDTASYRYEEDGALLIEAGKIVAAGDYGSVSAQAGDAVIVDHRPHLILPGLIDAHAHFPQMQIIASYGAELLEWLNTYTFPEERKFSDPVHAGRIAGRYMDELVRHGTTTAVTYCSVHPQSAEAFFGAAAERDMLMVGGKCLMDRNAPDGLRDTPQSGYDDSKALIEKWHRKGRAHYAITPRFAITSTFEQMEMTQALVAEFPDCHMQTHLAENHAEIELTMKLFPGRADYTDVYAHYGLLGERSLFGHCIHLSDREADALSESGSVAVFCPTSNLFLGSGLFNFHRLNERDKPVRTAIATDTGGGTNYSMLRTLDEGYKVIAQQGKKLPPIHGYYEMTLGNARALSLQDRIGTLDVGSDADITVLNSRATPIMDLRMETVETLAEELFLLQVLGDDRAVAEVYVAGAGLKGGI